MYEKIIVPLDGSQLSEVALPYAERLAAILGSEIRLVHVVESSEAQYQHMHQSYLDRLVETTKQCVDGCIDRTGGATPEVKAVLLVGHPAEEIVDYADTENIDLIVMATHGWSGLRRWVIGSVAGKVVSASNRPVALIRAKGAAPDVRERRILRKILVPLDGSETSEKAIPYVEELAARTKGEVLLYSVVPPVSPVYALPGETVQFPYTQADVDVLRAKTEEYLGQAVNALKEKGINARAKVAVGGIADEIIKEADAMPADLLAMSTHGRSGISRWAFGSTADKVLHEGNTPLLLVRVQG